MRHALYLRPLAHERGETTEVDMIDPLEEVTLHDEGQVKYYFPSLHEDLPAGQRICAQ